MNLIINKIKSILKIIFPVFVLNLLKYLRMMYRKRKHWKSLLSQYNYDARRFFNHSGMFYKFDNLKKYENYFIINYHVIEKGICMPDMKKGFALDRILGIIGKINDYINSNYSIKNDHFLELIKVLNEYKSIHDELNFNLGDKFYKKYNYLINKINYKIQSKQFEFSNNEYFENNLSTFDKFASSRHSVRNYTTEKIPIDLLNKSIKIASTAPSHCNTQANRVYIIQNKSLIKEILYIQNGNRGFGHLCSTLIILTAENSVSTGVHMRNDTFLTSGIFLMNLLYGLHFNKIAACPLNWCYTSEKDIKLRKFFSKIPQSETITCLISCGNIPEKIKVVRSPKLNIDEITTYIR